MDRLYKKDKAVVRAFTERRALDGDKLTTDGTRLDGYWMGGNDIAHWKNGKIHLPDTGGRSGQLVQNAVRREAPKNDLFNSRGWNPTRPGDLDRLPDKRTRVRARAPIYRTQGGRGSRSIVIPEGATGEVVSERYGSLGIAVIFDIPEENYIQWTGPQALELFLRDVEIDPSSTWQPPSYNPMACGDLSDKRCDQLNAVYDSAIERGYSKRRAAQQARGVVRKQVARDKRKRSRRKNPQWIRVPSGWLRPGMIVKAPEYILYDGRKISWDRAWKVEGHAIGAGLPKTPTRLLVWKWDDDDGTSELTEILSDGSPGAYVDFNTNDYPDIWMVEADSIPDLDDTARRQGQYPPDYEGNPRRITGSYATHRGHKYAFQEPQEGTWYAIVEGPYLDYEFGPYDSYSEAKEAAIYNIDHHVDEMEGGRPTAGPYDGQYTEYNPTSRSTSLSRRIGGS